MKSLIYIIVLSALTLTHYGQSLDKQGRKNLKQANYFLEMEDYVTAYFKFQDLKENYELDFDIEFGLGRCKKKQKGK